MKRFLFLIYIFIISISGICQSKTRLIKAKTLIKSYIKNNINDYSSYSPVSYSKLDSLFTSPEESVAIREAYQNALKSKEKAGLEDIDISVNVSPMILELKRDSDYDKMKVLDLMAYEMDREFFYNLVDKFNTVFIGWKIIHKYRAKNLYNATILCKEEFRFNKNMTKITGTIDLNDR